VGGDLYDFFRLDESRVFFMVGDVSGKGLPASLFMAFAKSLFRGAALRRADDVAHAMREVNVEVARDNPEGLYVTVFAAILDARTGVLQYCAAGHDAPYVLRTAAPSLGRLAEGGGLPLGVMDDAEYAAASYQMAPGETVCLMTDGVTDAASASGEFYGRARLEAVLEKRPADAGPEAIGEAIRQDVNAFAAGVEAADDLALVVVRWNGENGSA
jgi:serine phosphatase RsbU (regulator of sigma subunit)